MTLIDDVPRYQSQYGLLSIRGCNFQTFLPVLDIQAYYQ